ncbi:GIY-YIG nuclease family protein [Streptomyces sp. NPDC058394]|uniref:GIY-YIG nuclease family protein n=1 Tax=unclassified Streptomyces TaxID=2593676 RepID=UPI0036564F58
MAQIRKPVQASSPRRAEYRLFNAEGELLYVGSTVDTERRSRAHRYSKPWWPEV